MTTASLRSLPLVALLALAPLASADTLYVDANLASGAADGSSWADAFQGSDGLQVALAAAGSGDEVFVADGVYLPSATGVRAAAFALANGVTLYGSFAGGEAGPDERPPFGSADSVLSGDLNGDDGSNLLGDNSYHLLTTVGTDASAVIDGFVVSGGNANTNGSNRDKGAGILCLGAVSPTVRNCRFIANRCTFGGAAGYINNGGAPTFTDCSFEDGIGGSFGGAFDIAGGGAVRFERCLFRGNRAARAGAVELFSSSGPVMNTCVFVDNTATGAGGGGAIWLGSGGSSRARNCTFVGNSSTNNAVGGVLNTGVSGFRILNSILWDNTGTGGANQASAGTLVFHSLVQGGFTGTGNVDGDPLFADAPGLDFTPGIASPAIDAGDNAQVFPGTTVDFLGRPRLVDVPSVADTGAGTAPLVDMGAFELPADVWVDLGGGTSGVAGVPDLALAGPLTAASAVDLDLLAGAPAALALVFVSFTSSPAAFLGGTLHAFPFDELVVVGTDGAGEIHGSAFFPGAPSGAQLWFQVGLEDASVPLFGASLSNGVVGTVP